MLLAATIVVIFLQISIAEKSSLSKVYEHSETQIYVDYQELSNTKLVYARCNSPLPKLGSRCVVTTKNNAYEDSVGETKECTVNLKPELRYGRISNHILVYAFGTNKVLLVWTETQTASDSEDETERTILKTTVIHMNDCKVFEAKIEKNISYSIAYFDRKNINVIVFNDTYELKVGHPKNDCIWRFECERNYRLYTFDDQARQVGQTQDWPESLLASNSSSDESFVVPMELHQSEKKYLITTTKGSVITVDAVIQNANSNKTLQLWKYVSDCSSPQFRSSLINEAIGFCFLCSKSTFGCWQSDSKGELQIKKKITLYGLHNTRLTSVYNLRKGGILFAANKCPDLACYENGNTRTNDKYHFIKIDNNNNVQSVEVQFETKCMFADNSVYMKIFENNKGHYCIVRLCVNQPDKPRQLTKGHLEIAVQCYSSDKFKKLNHW